MRPSSLFTYAEGRRIVDSYENLAMRRVYTEDRSADAHAPADQRIYGIWDLRADEWIIDKAAREMLTGTQNPPWVTP